MKHKTFNKLSTCLLLLCLSSSLVSCGNSDDKEKEVNAQTLSTLNGHEVKFYYEYNNKLYRAMAVNISSTGEMNSICYDAKEMLGGDTYTYNKTSERTAQLNMQISYYSASEKEWTPEHSYKLEMTFTSANQGYATGKDNYTILYNGKITKVFSKLKWYFIIDSDELPDKNSIDKIFDQDETKENSDNVITGVLQPKVSSIHDYEKPSITLSVIKTSNSSLPESIGFCIGTSPNPTIDNSVICREESKNYMNGYSTILGGYITDPVLKRGTVYYIRPYHKDNDKVIYYDETSVETIGNNYNFLLIPSLSKIYTISYYFKPKGSYSIKISYRIHKGNNQDDFYNKTITTVSEGSGNVTWHINDGPYSWEKIHLIWGEFTDNSTGITYSTSSCPGGAGNSCL